MALGAKEIAGGGQKITAEAGDYVWIGSGPSGMVLLPDQIHISAVDGRDWFSVFCSIPLHLVNDIVYEILIHLFAVKDFIISVTTYKCPIRRIYGARTPIAGSPIKSGAKAGKKVLSAVGNLAPAVKAKKRITSLKLTYRVTEEGAGFFERIRKALDGIYNKPVKKFPSVFINKLSISSFYFQ